MISPDPEVPGPEQHGAARPGIQAPAALRAGSAVGQAFAACAAAGIGAAVGGFAVVLQTLERASLPFGAHGAIGFGACLSGSLLVAVAAARAPAVLRLALAGTAGLSFGITALLQGLEAPAAAVLVGLSLGLGLAAGVAPRQPRHAVLAAIVAACIVMLWQRVGPIAVDPVLAATLVSALWAVVLVPACAVAVPTVDRGRRRLGRFALLLLGVSMAPSTFAGPAAAVPMATAASLALAIAVLGRSLPVAALGGSAMLAASAFAGPSPEPVPTVRELQRHGTAEVRFLRARHELELRVDGQWIDGGGPERAEAPLAAVLVHALAQPGDRVLLLAPGTGRVGRLLRHVLASEVEVVDDRPALAPLRARSSQDGPMALPGIAAATDPPARVATAAGALAALPAGARQVVVFAEPLAAVRERDFAVDLVQAAATVAGDGLVVHVVALDHAEPAALEGLFAAAAAASPWNGLFVVGDAAVLVGARRPIAWSTLLPVATWSDDARWLLHRAHCGDLDDLQQALLGTLRTRPADETPSRGDAEAAVRGRAAVLPVLHRWIVPSDAAPPASCRSTLRRWQSRQAELRRAEATLRALGPDVGSRAEAQRLAAPFLPVGAPSALLQAALGVAGADGTTLTSPVAASCRAHAIDPTFFLAPPLFARDLPVARDVAGPLEDLAMVPPPERLQQSCVGDGPKAVALRVRFPSACARALVEALAKGPLSPDAASALRELADPFVLAETERVLQPRGRDLELLALWRLDLPMPAALAALPARGLAERRALAAALRGRRDETSLPVLADLLLAGELEVRRLAGEALQLALGERVPYDPEAPESERRRAAERVRSLHNRAP
ncbi:MAG: hypothetical protein JNL12_11015 [Planctomycetes bacterium]|nr:hypothetical protein [Planctomycetota bacterium]